MARKKSSLSILLRSSRFHHRPRFEPFGARLRLLAFAEIEAGLRFIKRAPTGVSANERYRRHSPTNRLSERGEAVARGRNGLVYVPCGGSETIVAEVDGLRGTLAEIVEASPHRIARTAAIFSCGGCAVQTLARRLTMPQWGSASSLPLVCAARVSQAGHGPLLNAHGQRAQACNISHPLQRGEARHWLHAIARA